MPAPLTAVEAVVAGVLARLRAPVALAGGQVHEEGEVDGLPETVPLAIFVGLDSAAPSQVTLSTAPINWRSVLRLDCFARRNARDAGGMPTASALHAQAHARLMSDPTLGGIASGIELLRIAPDREVSATRAGVLTAFYAIDHRSTHDSLLPA